MSTPGGMAPGSGPSRRRGFLFLASVVIVVQIVAWRGTTRLKAMSYGNDVATSGNLAKRDLNFDAFEYVPRLNKGKARQVDDLDREEFQSKHKKTKSSRASSSSASTSTGSSAPSATLGPECKPLPTDASPAEQCEHVREACPPSGHIDYLQFYYCIGVDNAPTQTAKATPTPDRQKSSHAAPISSQETPGRLRAMRAFALACIIIWMLFLFSWVGLVASDFFCPNLGTIAARLGLSESTAGVTFLAFGNGSPDVFSTFGAMRTGSGSLAIGELIGAASFIVSVISGSMMLIAPFRVKPYPFLRDVGFFTAAVALTMTFLFDGKLLLSESIGLIALYVLYAATVILGSWWQNRRHRRVLVEDGAQRLPSSPLGNTHMERQISSRSLRGTSSPGRQPLSAVEYDPDIDPFAQWDASQVADRDSLRPNNPSPSHSPGTLAQDLPTAGSSDFNNRLQRFRAGIIARHSLLGAVEFRDVVRNLQSESAADVSEAVFQSRDPERFLPHEHHHQHRALGQPSLERHRRNRSVAPTLAQATTSPVVPHTLHRSQSVIGATTEDRSTKLNGVAVDDPWREHGPGDACEEPSLLPSPALPFSDTEPLASRNRPTLPRLALRRPTGSSDPQLPQEATSNRPRSKNVLKTTIKALFPSLQHLHQKSWLGIGIGIITAPAILLLNLTLPVVDDAADQEYLTGEKDYAADGQIRLAGDEANLNARAPHLPLDEEEEDNDDTGRNIITLGSSSVDSNPWDSASAGHNRSNHLAVATALHKLPGDISPLAGSASPKSAHFPGNNDDTHSMSSDSSADSHSASQASHGFLVVAQCALAPPFCVWAIASSAESDHVMAKTLVALVAGLVFACLVVAMRIVYSRATHVDPTHYTRVVVAFAWARVALGFLVSILYIMTIVDEVVSILQTLGIILGLSDAILGLTVFAMGNSLGDLVANITIARMGHPVMAVSACFAGPLLNLLLGIGISGTWLLSGSRAVPSTFLSLAHSKAHGHKSHQAIYHIDVSPTLSVSGVGLLVILISILIAVPLNGFMLDRRIGTALIATYCIIMCTNIAVEVYNMNRGISV